MQWLCVGVKEYNSVGAAFYFDVVFAVRPSASFDRFIELIDESLQARYILK